MASLEEKVAYLKGLLEGMEIDTEKGEGKLIAKIVEALGEITEEIAFVEEDMDELKSGMCTQTTIDFTFSNS